LTGRLPAFIHSDQRNKLCVHAEMQQCKPDSELPIPVWKS
jgi:hypothetical protein